MARPNRQGCDDGDFPPGDTNDVRIAPGERLMPTALHIVKVENGWLLTVFLEDGRKMRHIAATPTEAGQTVRSLLARSDFDWLASLV